MQPSKRWLKYDLVRCAGYVAITPTDRLDMAELRRMFPDRSDGSIRTQVLDILTILGRATTAWGYPVPRDRRMAS
jgi:hypothetical protein